MDARAALNAAPRVAELMASELQLGDEWQKSEVQSFEKLAAGYLVGGGTFAHGVPTDA